MARIQNENQLQSAIAQALQPVINKVLEKILAENKDLIDEGIYNANTPSVYERTEEFREAWSTEDSTINNNHVSGKFFYDPDKMSVDPDMFQHGSNYYQPNDVREFLANLIYEGRSGPFFGEGYWTRKKELWKLLMNRLGKRRILSYVEEALKEEGINYTRHVAPLTITKG